MERVLPFLVVVPSPRKALPLVLLPLAEVLSAVHGYQRCARGLGFPAEIPTRGGFVASRTPRWFCYPREF